MTDYEVVRAGDLTNEHVGRGAWLPAVLVRDDSGRHVWVDEFRRISMISHTTKGVKIRCSKSSHGDHSLAPDDLLYVTTEEYS